MIRNSIAAAAIALCAASSVAAAADISGAGATFPYPVYAKWADAYKKETGIGLNYQSIGSGGGIKQITARTVTFGASDKPLTRGELDKIGLVQFPTVMGGVVPVVNIKGISGGQVTLDGKTLADIFLGKVKKWNDAAVKKLNPSVNLPNQAIAVAHRSDGSGTTFLFTDYLAKVNADWKTKVGVNTSVQWPTGIGGKGNEGVAAMVSQTRGAIGYVEYAYAKQNKLTYVNMVNSAGQAVAPSAESFRAAAAGADWAGSDGFHVILTNAPGAKSWPIAGATFILMYKQPRDAAAAEQALRFFAWAYAKGDKMAMDLDYVPMPESVVNLVKKSWADNIKAPAGGPLLKAN